MIRMCSLEVIDTTVTGLKNTLGKLEVNGAD